MNVEELNLDNWEYLKSFFPSDWQPMLKELGVLKFGKKFSGEEGPSRLVRSLLIHLAGNHSLRTTCALAKEGGIVDVSDVALLKRLKKSGRWFTWMTDKILEKMNMTPSDSAWPHSSYNFRLVDASAVKEPGITGSKYMLHYSMNASSVMPDEVVVTNNKTGESFRNFSVQKGDVLVGDRAYATRKGIHHVHQFGGHALVRFSPHNLPLHSDEGKPFRLLEKLRKLNVGDIGDYQVVIENEGQRIKGRVCALRRDRESTEKALRSVRQRASKSGQKTIKKSTLEYAKYVLVFTTLPLDMEASQVLETYRYRWQIELVFKRLKSIISAAPLYKKEPTGMIAWLCGKVFIATLMEYMLYCTESFFPWGYPLHER